VGYLYQKSSWCVVCSACNCKTVHKSCDPVSGQCLCPPGSQGSQCDQCLPFYYNWDFIQGCQVLPFYTNYSVTRLWSRSRRLGLETYQRLVSVSPRLVKPTSRSRELRVAVSSRSRASMSCAYVCSIIPMSFCYQILAMNRTLFWPPESGRPTRKKWCQIAWHTPQKPAPVSRY